MANEQIALSFGRGITNVPSDATCDDNELEECVGMTFDDGEHRVIQNPVTKLTGLSGKTLLFIHKLSDADRYICRSGNEIVWGTLSNNSTAVNFNNTALLTVSGDVSVTAIGKTLIIADNNGLHYAIRKANTYDVYNGLPEPKVEFAMSNSLTIVTERAAEDVNNYFLEHEVDAYVAAYYKNLNALKSKKKFSRPFSVRYALELYDGTYAKISNPILLFPFIRVDSFETDVTFAETYNIDVSTYGRSLMVLNRVNLSDWSDIIKNIVVFCSNEVSIYNMNGKTEDAFKQIYGAQVVDNKNVVRYESVALTSQGTLASSRSDYTILTEMIDSSSSIDIDSVDRSIRFMLRPLDDIYRDLYENSVYYKLFELGLGTGSGYADGMINEHVLENITTQQRINFDEYFSHAPMSAKFIYAYNSRLNLANIRRGFFEGFDFFMPYDYSGETHYYYYVRIKLDNGYSVVRHPATGSFSTKQKLGYYFYYPDPRADYVTIIETSDQGGGISINRTALDAPLKEHPGLHGAYFFHGIPVEPSNTDPVYNTQTLPGSYLLATSEELYNQIATSEVNNPFVFTAAGYNTIGNGKIMAMSTLTQALSQGQFGQYPLLVFSTDGIWAMSVDGTGLFQSIHPMSREVCNNSGSITQTDGAVFFTSKKGLMVVVGSQVRCVSEQLSGKTGGFSVGNVSVVKDMGHFGSFLEHCFIAYDYRDSLLWLFDGATHNGVKGLRYCYVYAIRSETFAKYDFGADIITSVCNDYPDYLLQSGGSAFSLTGRSDINADATEYSGTVLTRPMKFDNALALKNIRRMQNVRRFTADGAVSVRVFASNDLSVWSELQSLRCMPWKYFRLLFDFSRLKATDRFAGTVIVTQERRTNKLR